LGFRAKLAWSREKTREGLEGGKVAEKGEGTIYLKQTTEGKGGGRKKKDKKEAAGGGLPLPQRYGEEKIMTEETEKHAKKKKSQGKKTTNYEIQKKITQQEQNPGQGPNGDRASCQEKKRIKEGEGGPQFNQGHKTLSQQKHGKKQQKTSRHDNDRVCRLNPTVNPNSTRGGEGRQTVTPKKTWRRGRT